MPMPRVIEGRPQTTEAIRVCRVKGLTGLVFKARRPMQMVAVEDKAKDMETQLVEVEAETEVLVQRERMANLLAEMEALR